MPYSYQPVTLTPPEGGDLVTRASHENVGAANYVVKRDWRRDLDVETRREGDLLFYPNTSIPQGDQPYPVTDEPITLVHAARAANGRTAIIVGTPTRLFRYFALDGGAVYEATGTYTPVFETTGDDTPVYDDNPGGWLEIGHGFSSSGNRWEARNIAGLTVFNNGVDLPVVYDLNDFEVTPLYQLREQGVAYVGTIEEYNGFLMLADIAEIIPSDLPSVFLGVDSDVLTANQSGFTITSSGAFFTEAMVGQTIVWDDGSRATITEFVSDTLVLTTKNQTISSQFFRVALAYGTYTGPVSRVQYRIIWSDLGDPTDFAAGFVGTILAGQNNLSLEYPILSLRPGDQIVIPGAGVGTSTLTATVLMISEAGKSLQLDKLATYAATNVNVLRASALASIAASVDLQDDSSGIIRMLELQGRLVVFKDTSIFLGNYTGVAGQLFSFQRVYSGPKTLFWKWIAERINGQSIVFAGRNNFYVFDLSNQTPREHAKLSLCQNLFFDSVDNSDQTNSTFSSVNAVTQELWITYPSETADKAICYDYVHDTCSTVGAAYTASATVKRPRVGIQTGPSEDWFVLGLCNGTVVQYGKTDLGVALWTRRRGTYDSILKSGLVSFGDDFDEKDWRSYVLYLGTLSGNPRIEVTGYQTRNAYELPAVAFVNRIASPGTKNLIPVMFRNNYFQDQIRVSQSDVNVRIARRTYESSTVASRGANRKTGT